MMETKDIYTASGGVTGGNGMETKSVPGYVPSPLVRPDFVEPEQGDATETAAETSGNDDGKSADSKSTTSKTASKSSTTSK